MRFYPQCPHPSGNWLKVELRLFRACVEMLPRLRAEEELAAIQRGHAFTDRPLEDRVRTRYVTEMKRLASGGQQTARPMSKGDIGVIASMGIRVRKPGKEE